MFNTYINDNALSNYPFSVTAALPFSQRCISGMGICIMPLSADAAPVHGVVLCGLELSPSGADASLETDSGVFLGHLRTSGRRGSGTLTTEAGGYRVSGWMTVGTIPAESYGTYACSIPVDASCITVRGPVSGLQTVIINGTEHMVSDTFSISADGLLKLETDGSGNAVLTSTAPADTVLSIEDSLVSYPMVSGINTVGAAVCRRSDYDGTLKISVSPQVGESASPDSYIKMRLYNETHESDIVRTPYSDDPDEAVAAEGARQQMWVNLNDRAGDSVILELSGTKSFPSCYAKDKDDAEP